MKFLKSLACAAAMVAATFTASAQFHGPYPFTIDVCSNTPLVITTGGISNILTEVNIGKDGFSVTPLIVATNAATSNVNVQASVCVQSNNYSTSTIGLGNLTLNGTTAVRANVFVPASTIGNAAKVKITITNASNASIIVSNCFVTSWQ